MWDGATTSDPQTQPLRLAVVLSPRGCLTLQYGVGARPTGEIL